MRLESSVSTVKGTILGEENSVLGDFAKIPDAGLEATLVKQEAGELRHLGECRDKPDRLSCGLLGGVMDCARRLRLLGGCIVLGLRR